jgi:hypothetical protein
MLPQMEQTRPKLKKLPKPGFLLNRKEFTMNCSEEQNQLQDTEKKNHKSQLQIAVA